MTRGVGGFGAWARAVLVASVCLLLAGVAVAQATGGNVPIPTVQIGVGNGQSPQDLSTSLQILALLTVLSLAPAILILTTAFTRIVIVLSFVRTALGTPTIPPNQVLVGLSLMLSFFVMGPTYERVYAEAIEPHTRESNPIPFDLAVQRAQVPIRDFMLKHTYESDLKMMLEMRGQTPETRADLDFFTLIPAFVISELKTAFVIGFYIFIPFILIDLIVASLLMGMGMMMMPPTVVSLPAKLLVFVLADGWAVLARAILGGFG